MEISQPISSFLIIDGISQMHIYIYVVSEVI